MSRFAFLLAGLILIIASLGQLFGLGVEKVTQIDVLAAYCMASACYFRIGEKQ